MSVQVDWFGFVEGVANDARGMPTLVGYSPKFQVCPSLPAATPYFLVLGLIDDGDPEPILVPDRSITLDLRILQPDGTPLVGTQQTSALGEKKYEELPGSALVFVGAVLQFRQYGRYRAEATITINGTDVELRAHRDLYILAK
jgi:hypothetical protein